MKKNDLLKRAVKDLQLGFSAPKGQKLHISDCWHFSTDGNSVDAIFLDRDDFVCALNRIYVLYLRYDVLILAFAIMDTHVHFILYGSHEECTRFVHEYVRLTSMSISTRHGERKKMLRIPISHQQITDDIYLKTAICYVIKNPPVGGLMYNYYDYPWSSGSLYFRNHEDWTSPGWGIATMPDRVKLTMRESKTILRTHCQSHEPVRMLGDLIFPGEYVSVRLVEDLFRTCRSFNFFICTSRESDVESKSGMLSRMSIPMQEMRQNKQELCLQMFGTESTRTLDMEKRLMLARTLRSRYHSSVKQIARLCGLVYNDIKDILK